MKVEKINNNKAMIILTTAELASRKITLKDIKEGKSKVQDFFFEILEEAQIIEDFSNESTQLLVEVSSTNDDVFMITLTKADCIPDMMRYNNKSSNRISYTVSSSLYEFSNIDSLHKFCLKALIEDTYLGNNSLYELNGKFFVYFSNPTIKKTLFVKTFSILSEYVERYYSRHTTSFLEHAHLIIENHAIQKLQENLVG